MNSASLCGLEGQYDNPIPPRFLASIDSLKIPAHRPVSLAGGIHKFYSTYKEPEPGFLGILLRVLRHEISVCLHYKIVSNTFLLKGRRE
jgi:hypothetical protein